MAKCEYRSLPNQKDAAKRSTITPRFQDDRPVPENLKIFAKGRSYFIRTYGCQANIRDEEVFAGYLEKAGFVKADSAENANVVLINTCAVRENAEEKIYGEIGLCKANKDKDPDFLLDPRRLRHG
jgi:tRNA-2-methylthio-N6-dimethylallyladenosine synthase